MFFITFIVLVLFIVNLPLLEGKPDGSVIFVLVTAMSPKALNSAWPLGSHSVLNY